MKMDFALLECLEAVVTEGSFEKAAASLAITQSAVSQRIRVLEQQTGTPLLFRTRPVRPTPAAQPLLRFARQTQLLALDVWPELMESAERGRVRIAVNADSLWILGSSGSVRVAAGASGDARVRRRRPGAHAELAAQR